MGRCVSLDWQHLLSCEWRQPLKTQAWSGIFYSKTALKPTHIWNHDFWKSIFWLIWIEFSTLTGWSVTFQWSPPYNVDFSAYPSLFLSLGTCFFGNSSAYYFMTINFLVQVSTRCPPYLSWRHHLEPIVVCVVWRCFPLHWSCLSVLPHFVTALGSLTIPHLVHLSFQLCLHKSRMCNPCGFSFCLTGCLLAVFVLLYWLLAIFFWFFFWLITIFWILFPLNLWIIYFVLLSIIPQKSHFFLLVFSSSF